VSNHITESSEKVPKIFFTSLIPKKSWNGPKVGEIFEQIVKFQVFQSSLLNDSTNTSSVTLYMI